MKRMTRPGLSALALMGTLHLAAPALAGDPEGPGDVDWWQKIGDGIGGFDGSLDDGDSFGFAMANIGDLDGDGVDDLAVGAHLDDDGGDRRGALYILFLKQNGTVKSWQKISDTAGNFHGTLDNVDWFGSGLAGVQDYNNDGIRDLAVGAALDDDGGGGKGAIWILFLDTDGTVKGYSKISDWYGGFSGSMSSNGRFGFAIADIGDLDGDDVHDLAVGAPYHGNNGATWILFMNSNGTVKGYSLINTLASSLGQFGWAVTGLGDLDGDNVEDIAIGARRYCDGGGPPCNVGSVYVVFLNSNGTVKNSQRIGPGIGGFTGTLDGYDFFGSAVANIGDLNGDGITDLAIGSPQDDDGGANSGADIGAVWLAFLNTDGTVKALNKISSTSGNFDGVLMDGDRFGTSLCALGDFDGNGVVDLATGASNDHGGGYGRGAAWLTMLSNPLWIDTDKAPAGEVGAPYFTDLGFGGGAPPYVATIHRGKLPPGMNLADDGTLDGTPTRKGRFDFTVRLEDDNGQRTARKLTVVVKKPIRLDTPSLGKAKHGESYQKRLSVSGGQRPYSFAIVTENLPDGIELDEESGRLSGVPTEVGNFPVTIQVSDELGGSHEVDYLFKVRRTLKITTESLPKGKVGKAYVEKIKAKGGVGGYSFELMGGALPDGIDLEEDEANNGFTRVMGQPTTKGRFDFTLRVTDSSGAVAEKVLKIKIR